MKSSPQNSGVKVLGVIILLPPSEGKMPGGRRAWKPSQGRFGRNLGPSRQAVVAALSVTPATALKVRGKTAELALAANAQLIGAPVLPAHERYSGVVYQGLAIPSLSPAERAEAMKSILIVTGLGGLVALDDPIPDYRAPIDSTIRTLGTLSTYWRPHLEGVMNTLARDHLIIDLLPLAHRAATVPTLQNWVRITLSHKDNLSGHAAKHAKGELARWLLTNDVTAIKKWRSGGWSARVD